MANFIFCVVPVFENPLPLISYLMTYEEKLFRRFFFVFRCIYDIHVSEFFRHITTNLHNYKTISLKLFQTQNYF